eukprot:CAMPEP_0182932892 /NCGR_PEP_ID=MMETSP0105_2-20130417/32516_1 /TAXON_ID=81532 ORGANISM="Acanthoeca-like sp., Strain 10tr" /NCGR_SAMPLE_ID=MMETSP0105_2 /ASSEMBLY_ACC=CAM_ASM_000205 /LENGTH=37 /DNA_ID= /DNA_START= /DNA_END= /DNA_ORIENTATION=
MKTLAARVGPVTVVIEVRVVPARTADAIPVTLWNTVT